jgi:uncharacterized C2H2 Zn-finger protein
MFKVAFEMTHPLDSDRCKADSGSRFVHCPFCDEDYSESQTYCVHVSRHVDQSKLSPPIP